MRYASYCNPGQAETWGIAREGLLYDLGPTGKNLSPSLKDAIRDGVFGDSQIDLSDAPTSEVEGVRFLPPIVNPTKILCIGVNYRAHQEESGKAPPAAPTVFTRFADSQMGHQVPAIRPGNTTKFDYEGEMALVIGKPAYQVSEDKAWEHVAGYGVYNDFSVRDWQLAASQWIPGKNFPSTGAFGPYLVPASDLPHIDTLHLETRVNGEVRQSAYLSDLVFTIPELIAYVSAFTALAPGDVIVTGTPGGVGLFMEPQGMLSDGDLVDVEITGLGVLTNPVLQGA